MAGGDEAASKKLFLACFPEGAEEVAMVIGTEATSNSLPRYIWPVKGGQREGELGQGAGVVEGHDRGAWPGALAVGDLAVERSEVRGAPITIKVNKSFGWKNRSC